VYRLKIIENFSSAHQLQGYKGKCEDLHGHNWKVEVEVKGEKLNSIGLLMDFKDLKETVRTITEELDHRFLNDIIKDTNPSSELIARYIHRLIKDKFPDSISLASVTVWESDNSCATYSE
jgi:6-pyruvoyltetrahydropterin/6-carboxytetrahydropterin synthase